MIAIDGTGTENWPTNDRNPQRLRNGRWLSHVKNFAEDYEKNGGATYYDYGPRNGMTGSDLPQIENKAFAALEDYMRGNPSRLYEPIDIIGWSRGAYAAMRLAGRLKNGLTFYTPYHSSMSVRFLGLYDPVDMTMSEGSGSLFTDGFISSNVKNVVWVHGVESTSGNSRDYDSDSPFYYNWPRIAVRSEPMTTTTNIPLEATHGAIGGTPGYSPDKLSNYSWSNDVSNSILADTKMRTIAQSVGVPINVLSAAEYGFPELQAQLPQIRERTWGEFFAPSMGAFGSFSFSIGMGF